MNDFNNVNPRIVELLQQGYREENKLAPDSIIEPEQMGLTPVFGNVEGNLYYFDGNMTYVFEDTNNNNGIDNGEARYFTDANTLGERSYLDRVDIKGENNVVGDVKNSLIYADASNGTIYGKDIALLARKGSNIEMRLRGGENFAAVDGAETKVLMRDHTDPDDPRTIHQTTLNAFANNGGEVIQGAYHSGTVNNGIAVRGGTINQQGGFNYGRAEDAVSYIGQQGSRRVNNLLSFAQANNGAQIRQQGSDPDSLLEAEVNNAKVYQVNPDGTNYTETHGGSMVSQKGRDNITYGTGVDGIKQVNTGGGENRVSEGLSDRWITMGPDENPKNPHGQSYINSSPFSTLLDDSRAMFKPGMDMIFHTLEVLKGSQGGKKPAK